VNNEASKIYPIGAKVSLGGTSGAYPVVEHIIAPFAKGANDGRPCGEGERPTHYSLQNHRANRELAAVSAVAREAVSADRARALIESLRAGEPEPLDALAAQGLVVPSPAPRGARPYDVAKLDLSIEDNARVLRAYYALDESAIARGPAAWLSSFERLVLGELALVVGISFESLRDELHRAHPGIAAYDANAERRAIARKAAMEKERKRKKKPLPLP
jgi:hypothetical protein